MPAIVAPRTSSTHGGTNGDRPGDVLLVDRSSSVEVADYCVSCDDPLSHHLALAGDAVAIYTGVNGDILVTVQVLDSPQRRPSPS